MRHNHATRDIKPPGECPACDEHHGVPVVAIRHVLADEARRTSGVDLYAWTEERVLIELVRRVYKDGMVGLSWPALKRLPLRPVAGELVECPPELATEWRIVASVRAMPA